MPPTCYWTVQVYDHSIWRYHRLEFKAMYPHVTIENLSLILPWSACCMNCNNIIPTTVLIINIIYSVVVDGVLNNGQNVNYLYIYLNYTVYPY